MDSKKEIPSPLHLGLTGYPLGHSLSPTLHAAALQHYQLEGDYQLYPVDDPSKISDLTERLRRGELHGLNVTIPYKQAVLPLVDELTPAARAIGAVNTLIFKDRLIGDNTDAPGFWADLEAHWQWQQHPAALILGSGGAARGIIYALASHGWQITIAAARPEDQEQALKLAADIGACEAAAVSGAHLDVIQLKTADLKQFNAVNLLVNTTPLGMSPHVDATPWPDGVPYPAACRVYDAIYNPLETRFIRTARAQGLSAETGLGMLACQAALAFERWTGLPAPFDVMRRSVGLKI
jgi:shikimate dehydrogenase